MDKFQGIERGTLVKRSEHWYQVHPRWPRGQLGIVVDRFLDDQGDHFLTFPIVQWEGEVMSSTVHPDNMEIAESKYRQACEDRQRR